jgi:hypothetical protein
MFDPGTLPHGLNILTHKLRIHYRELTQLEFNTLKMTHGYMLNPQVRKTLNANSGWELNHGSHELTVLAAKPCFLFFAITNVPATLSHHSGLF